MMSSFGLLPQTFLHYVVSPVLRMFDLSLYQTKFLVAHAYGTARRKLDKNMWVAGENVACIPYSAR